MPYYENGTWYASEPGGGGGGGSSGSMTVYAQGYTHAYAWDANLNPLLGAWPGSALGAGPNGWSEISISEDCANIIFSNNGSNQTSDLYTCNDSPYYSNGAWYATGPNGGKYPHSLRSGLLPLLCLGGWTDLHQWLAWHH